MSAFASPSLSLGKALEQWLETLPAGEQLAAGHELARQFGISEPTVRRVLKKFVTSGRIVRIRGKGTFIAPLPAAPQQPQPPQRSSTELVAAKIEALIAEGSIKRGESLWPLKWLSSEFGVSMGTVIKAYRLLESKDLIYRYGRSYRVGKFKQRLGYHTKRMVVYLKLDDDDFGALYSSFQGIAKAYRRMEWELTHHEVNITYANSSEAAELIAQWGRTKEYPAGIMIVLGEASPPQLLAVLLEQCLHLPALTRPKIVIHAEREHTLAGAPLQVNLRHAQTVQARTVAHYSSQQRFERVTLWYDATIPAPLSFIAFTKILVELDQLMPVTECRVVIRCTGHGCCKSSFEQSLIQRYGQSRLDGLLSKYSPRSLAGLLEEAHFVAAFETQFHHPRQAELWIFAQDIHALAAYRWAGHNGVSVPGHLALITLENQPHNLHHGITACVEDWESTGYLMAHALLGSFPLTRTSKGYMQNHACLLHRLTTLS